MKVRLEKGRDTLELAIPEDKVAQVLVGKAVAAMDPAMIKQTISEGIRAQAPDDLVQKKIAVLIPDDTRLWARGDIFVPHIVNTLFDIGVSEARIKIIIALGTHKPMAAEQFVQLAGTFGEHRVEILNSANKDQERLVYLGETSRKTVVTITREAVDAEHIIIFGGILHHMLAGFGGGRKYILPGIAGYDAIQQNHSLAITPGGRLHPLVGPAILAGNPVHADLEEAADIFLKEKTCTYVAVAANGRGEIFHCAVGPLGPTFLSGCQRLDAVCCVQVPEKADFALISAGGYRTDGQLYQATKALFNAVNVVKEAGAILFVAGCAEGVGTPDFASALMAHRGEPRRLGSLLANRFNMPAYIALRLIDLLNRYRITLVSDIDETQTEALGFGHCADIQDYVDQLTGKGYIIPFAENILPLVEAA